MKSFKNNISLKLIQLSLLITIGLSLPALAIAENGSERLGDKRFFRLHRKPTMSAYYGITSNSLKDLNQSLANPRLAEIRIGRTKKELESESANIIKYRYSYCSLTNISNDLGNKSTSGEITTDLWRFGLGEDKGFGYWWGDSKKSPEVILCHSGGIQWSKLKVKDGVTNPSDSAYLALFDDAFRFGTNMEAGVKIRVLPLVAFDAGFERAIVFPRHLFWKWVLSEAMEGAIQFALDEFVDKIMDSTPSAAPVVNFILKNGLTYGIYELRKEKMNYPFDSAPPLVNDSFKFGLTFVF